MAIAGPNVQLPISPFVNTPQGPGELSFESASFLRAVQSITFYSSRSGPTASRPTSTSFRWVGMPFFDTTLGFPVFLKIASSSAWVKADGTPA